MTSKTPHAAQSSAHTLAHIQAVQKAANSALRASIATRVAVGGALRQYRLYDYAFTPTHPDGWTVSISRDLDEQELIEAQQWLWQMAQGQFHLITHYTPALRLLVFCERSQDAAMFKLSWGGE